MMNSSAEFHPATKNNAKNRIRVATIAASVFLQLSENYVENRFDWNDVNDVFVRQEHDGETARLLPMPIDGDYRIGSISKMSPS
jgi:hypothetical protein